MTAYTLGDVARICGVSRRRLRYWERIALLPPSSLRPDPPGDAEEGTPDPRQTAFDFAGLATVRNLVGLLENGVPLRRIREDVETMRERIPDLEPLPALRAWGGGRRVVVRHEGVLMHPDGQLVLEWSPGGGVQEIAAGRDRERTRRAALDWFERGCELDGDRETYAEAAEAYRKAIETDPDFADAWCNLGSVHFNQDRRKRARECFERAVEIFSGHVEANLNLGTLCEDDGRNEVALRHYRAALATDPLFPDTHVSLGLVYEKLGLARTARAHWRRYLMLEPRGVWSDLARRRLED